MGRGHLYCRWGVVSAQRGDRTTRASCLSIAGWLRVKDSNLDYLIQSQASYR